MRRVLTSLAVGLALATAVGCSYADPEHEFLNQVEAGEIPAMQAPRIVDAGKLLCDQLNAGIDPVGATQAVLIQFPEAGLFRLLPDAAIAKLCPWQNPQLVPVRDAFLIWRSGAIPGLSEVAFGDTHLFGNGVTITASVPERFRIDAGRGDNGSTPRDTTRVRVTVVNTSPNPINPMRLIGLVTLNGVVVEPVELPPGSNLVPPSHDLRPGQTAVFDQLFVLPEGGDLSLAYVVVPPGLGPETVIYRGRAAPS